MNAKSLKLNFATISVAALVIAVSGCSSDSDKSSKTSNLIVPESISVPQPSGVPLTSEQEAYVQKVTQDDLSDAISISYSESDDDSNSEKETRRKKLARATSEILNFSEEIKANCQIQNKTVSRSGGFGNDLPKIGQSSQENKAQKISGSACPVKSEIISTNVFKVESFDSNKQKLSGVMSLKGTYSNQSEILATKWINKSELIGMIVNLNVNGLLSLDYKNNFQRYWIKFEGKAQIKRRSGSVILGNMHGEYVSKQEPAQEQGQSFAIYSFNIDGIQIEVFHKKTQISKYNTVNEYFLNTIPKSKEQLEKLIGIGLVGIE